jgi:hypothetical protein
MKINKNNFYLNTFAVFKGCKTPKREPDYISYNKRYSDVISSRYWYGNDKKGSYVIRESDHWVAPEPEGCARIASCIWKINTTIKNSGSHFFLSGKCYFVKFKGRGNNKIGESFVGNSN